jgi:hypothetical protein
VKKVLRKIRRTHEVNPRNHARKVITGSDGSSVSGTTSATSSTRHLSSESEATLFVFSIPSIRFSIWFLDVINAVQS